MLQGGVFAGAVRLASATDPTSLPAALPALSVGLGAPRALVADSQGRIYREGHYVELKGHMRREPYGPSAASSDAVADSSPPWP
jgi:hypothetical protein